MAVVVLAARSGLLGHVPLSHKTVWTPDRRLAGDFEPLARFGTSTQVTLHLSSQAGSLDRVPVVLSSSITEPMGLQQIIPAPVEAKSRGPRAGGGLTEVAVSKAAAASSQDPKVKQFADQMVRDHSKANEELSSLAKSKGLQVPTSLDAEHQAVVQKLSNKKGPEIDAAYGKQMKEDHATTDALFQSATKSSDPDLAAFAKKTLPTLMEHKRMAGDLPGAMHSAQAASAAQKSSDRGTRGCL